MDPPTLMFSVIGEDKDTHRNILATGEFVVNLPRAGDAAAVAASAAVVGPDVDEAAAVGLATAAGTSISAPRLLDAAVALECRFLRQVDFLSAQLVFGQVAGIHVRDEVLDERGRIDIGAYQPLGRLGGSLYTPCGQRLSGAGAGRHRGSRGGGGAGRGLAVPPAPDPAGQGRGRAKSGPQPPGRTGPGGSGAAQ